jgi:phasin family protein
MIWPLAQAGVAEMVEETKDSLEQPTELVETPVVLADAPEAALEAVEPVVAEEPVAEKPVAEKPKAARTRKVKPVAAEAVAPVADNPVETPAAVETVAPKARKARVAKAKTARQAPMPAPKVRQAKPVAAAPAAAVKPAAKRPFTANSSVKKTSVVLKKLAPRKELFAMATTTEMTEKMTAAFKDAQEKAKAALEKSQAAFGDAGEFAKGNVEAVVESTKILASGLQEMTKGYVAETKTAFEAMTADVKELTTVKSPTEFFEKQSALLRKNFDAAVAASSRNSEAMLKLANEAFQPISTRVSLAVEKIKKAA